MPNPYITAGKAITVLPPAAGCTRGVPIRVGDLVGLPVDNRPAGSSDPVELWTFGANRIPKAAGAGTAFTPGQRVWIDAAGVAASLPGPFRALLGVCTDRDNADAHGSVGILVVPFAEAVVAAGRSGTIDSSGVPTALLSGDNAEHILHQLTVPANTFKIGDRVTFANSAAIESITAGAVELRLWVYAGPFELGVSGFLVSGFTSGRTTVGIGGFSWASNFTISDNGAGPTAVRFSSGDFSGINVTGLDLTRDLQFTFTGALIGTTDPGNTWRGYGAQVGLV